LRYLRRKLDTLWRTISSSVVVEKERDDNAHLKRRKEGGESIGDEKVVAVAGTAIYAQADNWDTCSYRHFGGLAADKLILEHNTGTLPGFDRDKGERRAKLRLTIAMPGGRSA